MLSERGSATSGRRYAGGHIWESYTIGCKTRLVLYYSHEQILRGCYIILKWGLTDWSVGWDFLQFLHNIYIQQLKGQQILNNIWTLVNKHYTSIKRKYFRVRLYSPVLSINLQRGCSILSWSWLTLEHHSLWCPTRAPPLFPSDRDQPSLRENKYFMNVVTFYRIKIRQYLGTSPVIYCSGSWVSALSLAPLQCYTTLSVRTALRSVPGANERCRCPPAGARQTPRSPRRPDPAAERARRPLSVLVIPGSGSPT